MPASARKLCAATAGDCELTVIGTVAQQACLRHLARTMPLRKRLLFVCVNRRPDGVPKGSCAARGAVELHARLKSLLKERGLAETDVRACTSSCLDTCWAGPTIAVEPDHFYYGRVRLEDAEEIVEALAAGRRVERLVLSPDDFVEPRELRKREG